MAHIFLRVVVDERLEVVEEIDFFGMLRKTQVGLLFFQLLFFLKADFLGHFEDFTILLTPIRECSFHEYEIHGGNQAYECRKVVPV